MKRIILYITNATYGLSRRLQSHRLQNSDIVAANCLSRWFHYSEGDFAKDQLKRYLPALHARCTVGILQKADLLNFINMQNDLHRGIYSEAN